MFIRAKEGTSEKAASPSKLWREALGNGLFILDRNVREGGQIPTPDIFDQTSWKESIWDRLYS
jgi:hypothetical protein